MDADADVVVIGAGVSGLAVAANLARAGLLVAVLEGRSRLGGRVFTDHGGGARVPAIELGAEFVHGGGPALKRLLRAGGVETRAADSAMWLWRPEGLRPVPDYWERIGAVVDAIPARSRGWSFDDFLRRRGEDIAPADRARARRYVQSFNAAPAGRLSAHALRADRAGVDANDRFVINGYDGLVHALARRCRDAGAAVHLGRVVRRVEWRRGDVRVDWGAVNEAGAVSTIRARAAVVTLPLGILKRGSVAFDPPLREKARLVRALGWGQVVRVSVEFRPDFWRRGVLPDALAAEEGRTFGFVNAPGLPLAVWWAPRPGAPLLTGWTGGPAAGALLRKPGRAWRDAAVASLASIAGMPRARIREQVARIVAHDWSRDPFTRGAYSYATAGCEDGPEQLGRPVGRTLFFAGEATSDELGTVHGAFGSGERAAREVLRAL